MRIKTRKFSGALVLAFIGGAKLLEMDCFAMFVRRVAVASPLTVNALGCS